MKTILDNITEKIPEKQEVQHTARKGSPIDIIPLIKKAFFVIAEVKKGSPSKGIIRENFFPTEIASAYERGGASAVSVVTEKNFFSGEKKNLTDIKKKIKLPVLRKDFLIHPYQIYESFNMGADFVLLITTCLTDSKLQELYKISTSMGMEVLVEVHNEKELERVLKIEPRIIGINNRDLKTFEVDLNTSFRLKESIPHSIHVISESGIRSHEDIDKLKSAGFSGVLIGESLLRQADPEYALRRLIHG